MKRAVIAAVLAVFVACGGDKGTGPTSVAGIPEWSPYLGIHVFHWRDNILQPHLLPLLERGVARSIRTDVESIDSIDAARWALAHGAEDVLAVFPNEHLREADPWAVLSVQMRNNPQILYWEIGNEVELFIHMSAEEYTPIFLGLHERARQEFPDRVVIPQAIVGAGTAEKFLGRMLDLGVLRLAQEGKLPVLAVHFYSANSTFLPRLKTQIDRLPALTEVWVTETGVEKTSEHISFVREYYPRMRSSLRATRIYWYVFAECTEFSLVRGLPPQCAHQPEYSPLYTALMGGKS